VSAPECGGCFFFHNGWRCIHLWREAETAAVNRQSATGCGPDAKDYEPRETTE
jgi:hypothetical protein